MAVNSTAQERALFNRLIAATIEEFVTFRFVFERVESRLVVPDLRGFEFFGDFRYSATFRNIRDADIPAFAADMSRIPMVSLDFSGCEKLTQFPVIQDGFLEELDLSGTNAALPQSVPGNSLVSLLRLDLSECNLETVEFLAGAPSLQALRLCDNENLETLNGVGQLANLTDLDISRTGITTLAPLENSGGIARLCAEGCFILQNLFRHEWTSLVELNLASTNVIDFHAATFSPNTLRSVNLYRSLLVENIDNLTQCTSLEVLNIAHTRVAVVNLLSTCLRRLNAEQCRVTDQFFLASDVLEYLDLSSTDISNLESVRDKTSLKFLYMSGCNSAGDLSDLPEVLENLEVFETRDRVDADR